MQTETHLSTVLYQKVNFIVEEKKGRNHFNWSIVSGLTGVVELLLENGADLTAKNNDGETPQHIAMKIGNFIIKWNT